MLVLVDVRYQSEKIHNKLPGWIGKSLVITQSFGQAVKMEFHSFMDDYTLDVSVIRRNDNTWVTDSSEYECRPENLQDNGNIHRVQDTRQVRQQTSLQSECPANVVSRRCAMSRLLQSIMMRIRRRPSLPALQVHALKHAMRQHEYEESPSQTRRGFKSALVLEGLQPVP